MSDRFPPVCEKCEGLRRSVLAATTAEACIPVVDLQPHDELEKLAEVGHIEAGTSLYRCRRCDNWWEYEVSVYFQQLWGLSQIRPVTSVEKWRSRQQRRYEPHSSLVGALLLFTGGLLVIAAFFGSFWIISILFTFEIANWVMYGVVLGGTLLALWKAWSSRKRRQINDRS